MIARDLAGFTCKNLNFFIFLLCPKIVGSVPPRLLPLNREKFHPSSSWQIHVFERLIVKH